MSRFTSSREFYFNYIGPEAGIIISQLPLADQITRLLSLLHQHSQYQDLLDADGEPKNDMPPDAKRLLTQLLDIINSDYLFDELVTRLATSGPLQFCLEEVARLKPDNGIQLIKNRWKNTPLNDASLSCLFLAIQKSYRPRLTTQQ